MTGSYMFGSVGSYIVAIVLLVLLTLLIMIAVNLLIIKIYRAKLTPKTLTDIVSVSVLLLSGFKDTAYAPLAALSPHGMTTVRLPCGRASPVKPLAFRRASRGISYFLAMLHKFSCGSG